MKKLLSTDRREGYLNWIDKYVACTTAYVVIVGLFTMGMGSWGGGYSYNKCLTDAQKACNFSTVNWADPTQVNAYYACDNPKARACYCKKEPTAALCQ